MVFATRTMCLTPKAGGDSTQMVWWPDGITNDLQNKLLKFQNFKYSYSSFNRPVSSCWCCPPHGADLLCADPPPASHLPVWAYDLSLLLYSSVHLVYSNSMSFLATVHLIYTVLEFVLIAPHSTELQFYVLRVTQIKAKSSRQSSLWPFIGCECCTIHTISNSSFSGQFISWPSHRNGTRLWISVLKEAGQIINSQTPSTLVTRWLIFCNICFMCISTYLIDVHRCLKRYMRQAIMEIK